MDPALRAEDGIWYRTEAIAAFAHEIRTPLTSLQMLIELGRMRGEHGSIALDADLARLLETASAELTALVDDLQESSRLMRGRSQIEPSMTDLSAIVARARELLPPAVMLTGDPPPNVDCMIDAGRAAAAIAGLAAGVNRCGTGDGRVQTRWDVNDEAIAASFVSGHAVGGEARRFDASAGFAFFRARQFVFSMDGALQYARSEQYARIDLTLPRHAASRG